ncbi:MAG: ribbon-helix-helix protein, CopG family [Ignavibacteria bacterium]|jgi:metal-responsive CopG/Arc/MetJ family transcriptional regulator
MAGVKTAISLEKKLFDKVNELAAEMHISRSRLFTQALREYIKKIENKILLSDINAVYEDFPGEEEAMISRVMKNKQRKTIEIEPW